MIIPTDLSREELDKRCIRHVRTANGTRPDLKIVEIDGRLLALKDYRNSDPLFRKIVGPLLIRRELGALRRLEDVQGIPNLYKSLDKHALLIDYIDGAPLRETPKGVVNQEFYVRLGDLIDRMHKSGVAHCDLRTGGNVIVGKDGSPYLIDFASCVFRGRGLNPLIRLLFREFQRADRFAVLWMKRRFSPDLLTPEEEAQLSRPLPFERPAVFLGKSIRNLTRKTLTKQKN